MSDRSDDHNQPLLPTLARGATIRFISSEKQGMGPVPISWQGHRQRPAGSPVSEIPADDGDDDPTLISEPSIVPPGDEISATEDTQAASPDEARSLGVPRWGHDNGIHLAGPQTPTQAVGLQDGGARLPAPLASPPPEQPYRGARSGDIISDRYLVEGQIGRGGMGRVLRVRHQVLGKAFALKLIKAPIATDPKIREMFYREAKLASSLSHENICSIVDFGMDERFGLFMVMELLEGQTLFHRLYHKGRFAPKVACDVIWQIAEALRYIHDQSVIHGDIKSENILVMRTPERRRVPKLLDFGLARASVSTEAGHIEGTPEYLAPERIYGGSPSTASDIYALGILFYELLVGGLPFRGSIEQVFRMHIEQPVPRVSAQLEGNIDERVDDIIARATAKNPEDRHADVATFMYELRTLMNMLGMPLPGRIRSRASADPGRTGRPRSRTGPNQRAKAPAEIFDHAPVPLASVDPEGRLRTANQAFWKFLGMDDSSGQVLLAESPLVEIYPNLLDDLREVAALRSTVKRVLHLGDVDGAVVEVAVILSAAPRHAPATAGEIYVTLHPLGRIEAR